MRGSYFDHDPATGIVETYEETADGKIHIHTYQDVGPFLDQAQRLRNSGEPDDVWKKDECSMYASLPLTIVHDMLKRGINVFDQNDMPKVLKEVNSTYANFKTTYKHHEI